MTTRLLKDESGITMGLVIIMIVLIGVLGAGLLTFVSTDLQTVAETNRGQKAFEMADAGVRAAKAQIGADTNPSSYIGAGSQADWAPTASSGTSGKTLTMDGNTARVTIERDASFTDRVMFRVVSEGTVGQSRRKVEALISTPQWGVQAYFTPGDVYIEEDNNPSNGETQGYQLIDRVDFRGVSLFSGGNVVINDNFSYRGNSVWGYGNNNRDYVPDSPLPEPRKPSYWETRDLPQPHIRIVGNAACPELLQRWVTEGAFDSATSPGYQADVLGDWNKPPYNTVARKPDNTRWREDGLENYNGTDNANDNTDNDGDNTIVYYAGDADINPDPYPAESADPATNKFRKYQTASIAAEGRICRASDYAPDNDCDASIAGSQPGDGLGGSAFRLGYDSTTLSDPSVPGFYEKPGGFASDAPTGRTDDLTYPFNPVVPDVEGLRQLAASQARVGGGTRYADLGVAADSTIVNTATNWRRLYPNGNTNTQTVVFIDADGRNITLPRDTGLSANADKTHPRQGVLVVRCGNITNAEEFQGLIIVLDDVGPGDSATTCDNKGNYRTGKPADYTDEIDLNGYVFAEGNGDPTSSAYKYGIYLADGSNVDRLDPLHRGLPSLVGSGGEGGVIESWRECYSNTLNSC